MKKIILIVVIVIIFAGGIAAALFAITSNPAANTAASTSPSPNSSSSAKVTMACDVLSQSVAESLLGTNINKTDTDAANSAAQTPDLTVSNCTYMTKISDANVSTDGTPKTSGVTLLLYTSKSPNGASENKKAFKNQPAGVQNVSGIGDQAFFNPQFKQLHVLKNGNWYVLTYFKDGITNGSLDQDKLLAQKLKLQ